MSADTKLRRLRVLLPRLPRFFVVLARWLAAVARGRSVVVVNLPIAGQWPFLKPLVDRLRARDDVFLLFAVDDLSGTDPRGLLRSEGFAETLIFDYPLAALIPSCRIFLSPHIYVHYLPRSCRYRVCTFHGLPTKGDTFPDGPTGNWTDFFFIGPTHDRLFERAWLSRHPESRVRIHQVGYPKLDRLFSGEYDTSDFRRRYNLTTGRKVVLYAPAYNEGTSLREHGVRLIEELLKVDAVVLVKLHPALYSSPEEKNFTGGVDWRAEIERLRDRGNLRHVTDPDLTPCLAVADLMVSDISGAALEFMMLGKPVVFIDCPRFYEECRPAPGVVNSREAREDLCFNAGRDHGEVTTVERLVETVEKSLSGGGRPGLKPEELIYNPGRATEAAWQLLEGFLDRGRD